MEPTQQGDALCGVLTTLAEATPILFKIDDTWGHNGVGGRYYFNNTVDGNNFSIKEASGTKYGEYYTHLRLRWNDLPGTLYTM